MNTQENNKLIAEFMGWDILSPTTIPPNLHLSNLEVDNGEIPNFKFHSSWDWLMPVVEKINTIEDYKYSVSINYHYTTITDNQLTEIIVDEDTDTDTRSGCYKAVIEFINQYNK